MLRGMRNVGKTWVGKAVAGVLFTLLILSFAVWGIGDIFQGGAATTVARVGQTEISAETARQTYQNQLRQLTMRAGTQITPQQARMFGLDNQVLSSLVTEATLDERARSLGLDVSDQLVARAIVENPAFQNQAGQFDRNLFNNMLRNLNMSEQRYVAEQRDALARQQLITALASDVVVPVAAQVAVHRYGSERRAAEYIVLDETAIEPVPAPGEEELAQYFQENITRYRAPEYRSAVVLQIEPQDIADPAQISEQEARARYEQIAGVQFGTPERRTVQQIQFPSEQEAAAAAARLASGEVDFEGLAAERGVAQDALNLGTLRRGDFVDSAIAEAAFTTPEGEVSAPVAGRFGTSLVRVVDVEDASVQPFEEVADTIRAELALQRASGQIRTIYDQVEDQRAAARPLADIAAERGLAVREVPAVDARGLGPDGQPVPDLPMRDRLVTEIFESDVGVDNQALRTQGDGYVWFDVTQVQPARNRELDEVRQQVAADWRNDQIADRLAALGRDYAQRLAQGEPLPALAEQAGVQANAAQNLARGQAQGELTERAVQQIFATRVGEAGSAALGDTQRVVFRVTNATAPQYMTTTPQAEAIEARLRNDLAEDILTQLITQMQQEIGVSINETAFREAVGGVF
jgi:peptidyl-prolyl cis-trans isomerase D